MQQRLKGQ